MASSLRRLPAFRKVQRRKTSAQEENELAHCLVSSWTNLWSLTRSSEDRSSDTARLHSATATVQMYYACYVAAATCLLAQGFRIDGHLKFLRTVSNEVVTRQLLLPPFGVSVRGSRELGSEQYKNGPSDPAWDEPTNGVSQNERDSWPMVRMLLRTTRESRLKERYAEERRKRKRRQLSQTAKHTIENNTHPTTVFDYLFRLRVRSNYKDVRGFLMGGTALDHLAFVDDLRCVSEAFCLQATVLTAARVGTGFLDRAVSEFHPAAASFSFIAAQAAAARTH